MGVSILSADNIVGINNTSTIIGSSNNINGNKTIERNDSGLFQQNLPTFDSTIFCPNGELCSEVDSSHILFPPRRDSLYVVVPLTIIYALILITGLLGNAITCFVILKNRRMRTATNYYLFSLAVSDLLLLTMGLPQEMYFVWSRYPYIFGNTFCLLRGLTAETSTNASVLTITAFTVERYVAICHPFLAHTISTTSRSFKLIMVIWLSALTFAIPQALQFGVVMQSDNPETAQCTLKNVLIEHSFELSSLFFFVIPMTLITVMYVLIGLKLKGSAKLNRSDVNLYKAHRHRRRDPIATVSYERTRSRTLASRRVVKMLVAVVLAFFICWAPFHAQRIVAIYGMAANPLFVKIYGIVTYISGVMYYVSATINPILYQIMSRKFRNAYKDTLSNACCRLTKQNVSYLLLKKIDRVNTIDNRIELKLFNSTTTDSARAVNTKDTL